MPPQKNSAEAKMWLLNSHFLAGPAKLCLSTTHISLLKPAVSSIPALAGLA